MIVEAWTSLEAHVPEWAIVILGTFLVHEAAFVLANAPYLLADQWGAWQQWKIHDYTVPLEEQWAQFRRLLKGHCFELLPLTAVGYPLLVAVGFTASAETLPSLRTAAVQFLVFNVIEDTGFYWVHRLLHRPYFYKWIHRVHHQFEQPYSVTGEVSHPLEFLFNILIPLAAGPLLMAYLQGVHILLFWAWISFRATRGADAHSGFDLPFHPLRLLPFYGGPRFHGFHHESRGRQANFGGYTIWDRLMGTDSKWHAVVAKEGARPPPAPVKRQASKAAARETPSKYNLRARS